MSKLRGHVRTMLSQRLLRLRIDDGKQTPWRGHPVFIAQHATATCCRNCLWHWHRIDKRTELSATTLGRLVDLIFLWFETHATTKRDCVCKTCRQKTDKSVGIADLRRFLKPTASARAPDNISGV